MKVAALRDQSEAIGSHSKYNRKQLDGFLKEDDNVCILEHFHQIVVPPLKWGQTESDYCDITLLEPRPRLSGTSCQNSVQSSYHPSRIETSQTSQSFPAYVRCSPQPNRSWANSSTGEWSPTAQHRGRGSLLLPVCFQNVTAHLWASFSSSEKWYGKRMKLMGLLWEIMGENMA